MNFSILSQKLENITHRKQYSSASSSAKKPSISQNKNLRASLFNSFSSRTNKENVFYITNSSLQYPTHRPTRSTMIGENNTKEKFKKKIPRQIIRRKNFRKNFHSTFQNAFKANGSSFQKNSFLSSRTIDQEKIDEYSKKLNSSSKKINSQNIKKDKKMSGFPSNPRNMGLNNILNQQYYSDQNTKNSAQKKLENPLHQHKFNAQAIKNPNRGGITITDVNAVKYSHMNKSEFKKWKKKELNLMGNFNRKFKMRKFKEKSQMLASRFNNKNGDKKMDTSRSKSANRGKRNIKINEIIKNVKLDHFCNRKNYQKFDEAQTRRQLFKAQETKKTPFLAKRRFEFESQSERVHPQLIQPLKKKKPPMKKNIPDSRLRLGRSVEPKKRNIQPVIDITRGEKNNYLNYYSVRNKGWQSVKAQNNKQIFPSGNNFERKMPYQEKTPVNEEVNNGKWPYREKENFLKTFDFQSRRGTSNTPQREIKPRSRTPPGNRMNLDFLKVNLKDNFYLQKIQGDFVKKDNYEEKVNIKEHEIEVKNPLLSNYGAYYKAPLEVNKDKSSSKIKMRNGILKNREHSSSKKEMPKNVKRGRSKSVTFKEEAEVKDGDIILKQKLENGDQKKKLKK